MSPSEACLSPLPPYSINPIFHQKLCSHTPRDHITLTPDEVTLHYFACVIPQREEAMQMLRFALGPKDFYIPTF